MEVDPYVAIIVPIIITLIRRFAPVVADNPIWSVGLAIALGALTSLAATLGIPLGDPGVAGALAGVASAVLGIGGVEVAKLAPGVRALNSSSPVPQSFK